jgi:hypothetical protein
VVRLRVRASTRARTRSTRDRRGLLDQGEPEPGRLDPARLPAQAGARGARHAGAGLDRAAAELLQWVDAENPWIDGQLWLRRSASSTRSRCCASADEVVGALDLSGTTDLTALGLVGHGRLADRRLRRVLDAEGHARRALEARQGAVPSWGRAGHMTATPGRSVDYAFVAQRLADLQTMVNLRRVCFDPYRIKYLEKRARCDGRRDRTRSAPAGLLQGAGQEGAGPRGKKAGRRICDAAVRRAAREGHRESQGSCVQKNPASPGTARRAVLEADAKNNRIFTKRKSRGRIDGIVSSPWPTAC